METVGRDKKKAVSIASHTVVVKVEDRSYAELLKKVRENVMDEEVCEVLSVR